MLFQVRQIDGALCCDGSLNIGAAESLRQALAEKIALNTVLTLDLSGIAECDAAGLQLLYSARKQAQTTGKQFQISNLSEAIQQTSSTLGFPLDDLMADSQHV